MIGWMVGCFMDVSERKHIDSDDRSRATLDVHSN